MFECRSCGTLATKDSHFCEQCGSKLLLKHQLNIRTNKINGSTIPLNFKIVIIFNYIIAGMVILYAFFTLITPQITFSYTLKHNIYFETIAKSYGTSIILFVLITLVAFLYYRLNRSLQNYSYKARNIMLGLHSILFINFLVPINLIGLVEAGFVIYTLGFQESVQKLLNYQT